MHVTILGATGLLGKALLREWRDDEIVGLGSKDVDIRSEQQVRDTLSRRPPQWIVLAAAYTDVDGCESRRDLAFEINCSGAENVARVAAQFGSRLLFLSTDYVFNGEKRTPYESDDALDPRSVYGQSKAAAEQRIQSLVPAACIVRTSWVFGVGGRCFPETILKVAATRAELEVVDDQRGCPTYAIDLARAIRQLCHLQAEGIVHVTNSGNCTWFDLARLTLHESGSTTLVLPTTTDKFVRPAPRPKYSVLSPTSLHRYQITMPTWQDAVARYLAERNFTR